MTSAGKDAATETALSQARHVIDVAGELTELLKRESELVHRMSVSDIEPLQPEKTRLTKLYGAVLTALTADAVKNLLPATMKARLVEAGQQLSAAAVENETMLRVGQTATDRLIGAIVAAIRQQRPATNGYAPRKVMRRELAVAGITVDRRF